MIILVKYKDAIMGSQTSVRAGSVDELKYQIFFRDNLKMLLDRGYNAKSAKIKKQFEYPESIYQAQCDGTLTEDMISNFSFETDYGGFSCLIAAKTSEEIDELITTIMEITAARRSVNKYVANDVEKVVGLLEQAKSGETSELIDAINSIHHVL